MTDFDGFLGSSTSQNTSRSSDETFTLTPPEPVAAVPREKAGGLVPVDDQVRADMARKAADYVAALAALDARSPEFAGKVGEITALGAGEMRAATAQSNRMLERTVRSLPGKGGDAQSQVAGSLVELRRVVEDLDPRELPAAKGRRFLSRLPGGNKLRDHLAKYASAQGTLNRIVGSLRGGQDELRRDNAALQTERVRLWEAMGKLQEYVVLTQALDTAVESHIARVDTTDPQSADSLRADVLFPVRQKHQDLLTQLAVCAQGYLAMDVVRRNNDELIKGVDRAATTTVSALRISVMLASALDHQKKVIEQVNALRGTTEDLIRANAEMLSTQSGEIQRIAADPAVGAETLRAAFQQIYRTLDAIDSYKVQATEVMANTVASLTTELQHAGAYLERSRSQGALEGGGPA
ncbi:toxic anion resistance protein [Streptomyces sp. NPDC059477]|uniref:toxic anion resistance protein n=1 Tax=Streptomyces sp. NPDC059477 TaxID=3346847 RepID=UPI0036C76BC5